MTNPIMLVLVKENGKGKTTAEVIGETGNLQEMFKSYNIDLMRPQMGNKQPVLNDFTTLANELQKMLELETSDRDK